MTRARPESGVGRSARLRHGRLLGGALLAALLLLDFVPDVLWLGSPRIMWFDLCQWLAPRPRLSDQIVIVEVDERSLTRRGQWPWPRTLLADLVDQIAVAGPAVIGLGFVMSEPDRLSPNRLPDLIRSIDPDLAARLAALPSNEVILAGALRGRPVVLGVVGVAGGGGAGSGAPERTTPVRVVGADPMPFLPRFGATLRSVDTIDRAASGHGLLDVPLDGGVVRRVPTVVRVGDLITPAFGLELLRVARRQPGFALAAGADGIAGVQVADLVVATNPDGSVWLRYARPTPDRFVSAADVLDGVTVRDVFAGKLVLVGVTALAVGDRPVVAGGGRRNGVEIHAELIDSVLEGALLARPWWAWGAERLFLLAGGVVVILTVPIWRARATLAVLLPLLALAGGGSLALYHWRLLLLDAATPSLRLIVLFGAMLGVALAEAERQRRALRRQVEQQREAAARVEGELSAAREIQMKSLPRPANVLAGETRLDLDAVLEPAREVGGDLYDFFRLDGDRFFLLLGDVTGKGVPASLFMAVSKALYKSTALRRGASVATMMREANGEISRDNSGAQFVTMFAAVLDLAAGTLEYCNAGHDPPYVIPRDHGPLSRLAGGHGVPLCVDEAFAYEAARIALRPGDTLCLVTDGVTEAANAAGEWYGRARLEALLAAIPAGAGAKAFVTAIRADVNRFVAGAEPADDLAIMVLRWDGAPKARSG
ncbi:MAG TPA: CHASE2 domain-containing protein [Methylomirabilota bacterium]|nr:CHASE2 domain-containing protein [Methylomirabilota bacterium]